MKKILLSIIIMLTCILVGTACHEHEYSSAWLFDETSHWQVCKTCNEIANKAEHTWDAGLTIKTGTKYTCTVCGYEKITADFSEQISGKNNDEVEIIGVVYGKVADGIYLSDGIAGAYAKLSSANSSKLATVKIGDKVKVTGKLSVTSSQVFVKNCDLTIIESGKDTINAIPATLDVIAALSSNDALTYGKLYNVVVAVSKDEAGRTILADETGSVYVETTQATKLAAYVDKRISVNISPLSYDSASSKWTCTAFEDGIIEQFIDVATVKDTIFGQISIPEVTDTVYKLTTSYSLEPSVVFNWTVKSGTALTITDNVLAINPDNASDEVVTLELTISSGETKASKEFTTTVPGIVSCTLAEALTNVDKLVKVNGLVVARGIADEVASNHYIIMMDETTLDLLSIRCKSSVCKSVNVGDKLEVVGKMTAMTEASDPTAELDKYISLTNIIKLDVQSTGNTVDYSKYNAVTLNTVEDYQDAIDNHHSEIRLYKVVNPYMIGSGSTSYSWNQFGPTKEAAKSGLVTTRQFCLLIENCAFNGLDSWIADFAVPKKNEGAKEYPGTVLYVYSVYQTGETKWSFILPNTDASTYDAGYEVAYKLENSVETELGATEDGVFYLPKEVTVGETTYAITWTSSDDTIINGATGAYSKQYEEAQVTLTANYTVGEANYQTNIVVNVSAATFDPLTISEAIAAGSQTVYKINAYVAAIAGSSSNTEEWRDGIVLTDGVKTMFYSTTQYTVGEVALQVGDYIEIKKGTVTVTADDVKLSEGTISIISTGNTIDYSKIEVAATITNEEEMVAFFSAHGKNTGLLVKFVGPFYFVGTGSTSSTKNARYQVNYVAAKSSAAARYVNADTASGKKTDGRTVSFSVYATQLILGENWYTEAGLPEKSASTSYECLGEFYAVSCGGGDTMQAWTVINSASKIEAPSAEYLINKQLNTLFATDEISAGADGTLGLPESIKVGGVDYPITWTSSNPEIVSNAGDFKKVTEEKTVTITATFTTDGQKTWTKTIKLMPKEVQYLTITEVINSESTTIEAFTGIIAGVASGNGGTINTYGSTALYVTDGTSVMAIDVFAGDITMTGYTPKCAGTALAVGDIIKVLNVTKVDHAIECNDNTTAVIDGKKTDANWFNPTSVTEIASNADISTYVKTITKTGVKATDTNTFGVLKLTGTAENPLYICAPNAYMLSVYYKDASYNTAKASSTVVKPGFNVNDGKYCYFGGHVASLHYAMGEAWLTANSCVTAITGDTSSTKWATVTTPSATNTIYNWGYTGTIYMIFSYSGSANYPYLYHGFLGAGCTLSLVK